MNGKNWFCVIFIEVYVFGDWKILSVLIIVVDFFWGFLFVGKKGVKEIWGVFLRGRYLSRYIND